MSARNWTVCQNCAEKQRRNIEEAEIKARESYGKVSAAKYEELMAAAKKKGDEPLEDTLREDYEIGVREGWFSVSYGCSCCKCGLEFTFKHECEAKQ